MAPVYSHISIVIIFSHKSHHYRADLSLRNVIAAGPPSTCIFNIFYDFANLKFISFVLLYKLMKRPPKMHQFFLLIYKLVRQPLRLIFFLSYKFMNLPLGLISSFTLQTYETTPKIYQFKKKKITNLSDDP